MIEASSCWAGRRGCKKPVYDVKPRPTRHKTPLEEREAQRITPLLTLVGWKEETPLEKREAQNKSSTDICSTFGSTDIWFYICSTIASRFGSTFGSRFGSTFNLVLHLVLLTFS